MTAATMPGSPDRMKAMAADLGRHWGWFLAFGLLSIAIGVLAIAWPGATIVTIAILFAASLLVAGIFNIVHVFDGSADTGARVMSAIVGVLGVIVGLALLREPFQSVVVMAFVIGIYWFVHGIMVLVGAFSRKEGRGWAIFVGVISMLAGLVILEYPISSLATLALVVGVWLVIMGIVEVIGAFRLRSAAKLAAS
jgi:uncharacterized membrane protein HdeD (DUF308 family)